MAKKKGEVEIVEPGDVKEPGKMELVKAEQHAEAGTPMALMQLALSGDVSVEVMEKLMDLQDRWEAKRAKAEFDRAMAKFQSDCPVIEKTKAVYEKNSDTRVRYKYAALENIVEQVKDYLARNGFSYSLDVVQDEKMLGVACKVTHKGGHSEVSTFSVPIGTEAFMSDVQKYGARVTFCKRYAFCNAFGILTGDEDTDATPETANDEKPPRQPVQPARSAAPAGEESQDAPEEKKFDLMAALAMIPKLYSVDLLVESYKRMHLNPKITAAQKMTCDGAFKKQAEVLGVDLETGELLVTPASVAQEFANR